MRCGGAKLSGESAIAMPEGSKNIRDQNWQRFLIYL
jgi:hypothetical protein